MLWRLEGQSDIAFQYVYRANTFYDMNYAVLWQAGCVDLEKALINHTVAMQTQQTPNLPHHVRCQSLGALSLDSELFYQIQRSHLLTDVQRRQLG